MTLHIPDFSTVEAASRRIRDLAHRTPVLTSSYFNAVTGGELYFKCENFQRIGAFKFRGACNAIMALSEADAVGGLVTHSSGNHGQAVALAARLNGYRAVVVMPEDASRIKVEAVREYGAQVEFCPPGTEARNAAVEALVAREGYRFVPPYNHPDIIAGQGTAAMELLEDYPQLDLILAPVGGGGLISGTAIAAKHLRPEIRVIGAEPENADDAARSFRSGNIEPAANAHTVADGLRATLGPLTFEIIGTLVDDIVTVPEASIVRDMRTVWERMKIVIEPSSAVVLSALVDGRIDMAGQRVGVIVTGGNVDLDNLPW